MSEILQDLSAPELVSAFEANLFEYGLLFRQWDRAEVYAGSDILWILTDIAAPIFNSIIRAQLSPDDVDSVIEAAIRRARSKNVPILWWTGPATHPADLGASLQAHGFVHEVQVPGMAVDLSTLNQGLPIPSGLVIEQVAEIETLRKWRHAFTTGFGMPDFMGDGFFELSSAIGFDDGSPYRNYVGFLNGEPVATSALFLAGGVAGIYNIATVPEARQKGIGAVLTFTTMREARNLGYKVGILEATEMGVSLYRKLGFQEYCKINQYVWASEHSNHEAG